MKGKLFSMMSREEQMEWAKDFSQWFSVDFPKIQHVKVQTLSMCVTVEHGLNLLSAFPYCRSFVSESLTVRDYHRRLTTILKYATKVSAEVRNLLNTEVDLNSPKLLTPHRGRPTREEAAAKALLLQKKHEEAQKTSLFGDGEEGNNTNIPVTLSSSKMPSLSELRWLMSDELQSQVERVRDLRARAEEASTRAKQMAEDGRNEEVIAPLAQEAAQCFDEVERIYGLVDNEMAYVYVRLKEDSSFIADVAGKSNLDACALRSWLRPYWDKVEDKDAKKKEVIDFIMANDPEQAAIRKANEERKQQADDIIKYLQRRDNQNNLKRLNTMEERLKILHSLIGDEAAPYDALLVAAYEDYEKNIKPKEMAKEAERKAKKLKSKEKDK